MTQLAQLCLVGDFAAARAVQRKYLPLMEVNFIESNPIPVKAAMVFWRLEGSAWPLQRAASTEPGVSPIQVLLVRSEQSGRSLPHDRRQQPLGPVSVLAAPKRRSGRSLLVSPFIPANPSMRSSVGRSPQCSMDRLHFFFSFELSYLRVLQKAQSGRSLEVGTQLAQKPLAVRSFIVQNGPSWS